MHVAIPAFASDDARRRDVIRLGFSGLDYIDVRGDGRTLVVAFFGTPPQGLSHRHFTVAGGDRITGIRVVSMHIDAGAPESEGVVTLRLDRAGDATPYTLHVAGVPRVDPLYATLTFTFDRENRRLSDCRMPAAPPPAAGAGPHIDYLAKDFATFRDLLFDRASLVMPQWNESHLADINVTLIELLAYVGDGLSYFQDAVATEAYLATARKRVSVRRHARLLGYRMHDGTNARAWLSLTTTDAQTGPLDPRALLFSTPATAQSDPEPFEPIGSDAIVVAAAHAPMTLYAWGNRTATLPAGAVAATLRDAWEPAAPGAEPLRALRRLAAGAYVIFESTRAVVAATVGNADPTLRHVVRLTHVRRDVDPLYDTPIVEIAWAAEDRLPFALPIAAPDPADAGAPALELAVAWGNVIAVDHGRTQSAPEALPSVPADPAARYRPHLAQPDLTFAEPVSSGSATRQAMRDPRYALPQIAELVTTDAEQQRRWTAVADLLSSGPEDAHFVVELDENGVATLRFGDGTLGRRPPPGAAVAVRYRVGNGVAGNVGAETIVNVVSTATPAATRALGVRNPLPAGGGIAPESADDVRALAPSATLAQPARAIAPQDYAAIAARDPRVKSAAAVLRWTGSRTVVRVALQPLGTELLAPGVAADVVARLEPVRRIGHDVEVVAATYVPLRVALKVTMKPGYLRDRVRAALSAALGSGTKADGTRGFFHPDGQRLGGTIAQSALIACAFGVAGVADVAVTRLARLLAPSRGAVPTALTLRPLEIAMLDADPARPERGILAIVLEGGM